MRSLWKAFLRSTDFDPSEEEIAQLEALSDKELAATLCKHFAKKAPTDYPETAGIFLLLGILVTPYSLVRFLYQGGDEWLFSFLSWTVIAAVSYWRVYYCARYWREHSSLRRATIGRLEFTNFGR